MIGRYRDGLTDGTPRKAVRLEDTPPPLTSEILAEWPEPAEQEIPLTLEERLQAMLPGALVSRETLSLFTEENRYMNSGRTTWVGIIKVLMGLLGTILAGSGIDVTGGTLVVEPGTAPFAIAALIGYFMLSGVQAFLTQDRDGGTGKTTVVGMIKSASGVLATVLLALGLDIGPGGLVAFDAGMTVWVIVLYLAYLILSSVQAVLSKDRQPGALAATPL